MDGHSSSSNMSTLLMVLHHLHAPTWLLSFSHSLSFLAIAEELRRTLDRNEYVAAILMDISKAFDCLPPNLIKANLIAYGLSEDAVTLVDSYLRLPVCIFLQPLGAPT